MSEINSQAQRVCLARALMRRPRLLLLDEATSALDPNTERGIIDTLETLTVRAPRGGERAPLTVLSVSHRVSTARNASHVLVLDEVTPPPNTPPSPPPPPPHPTPTPPPYSTR